MRGLSAGLVSTAIWEDRVTFHNEDFRALRVKARGQGDLITVVGHPVHSASIENQPTPMT
jgi:hypothetical protein